MGRKEGRVGKLFKKVQGEPDERTAELDGAEHRRREGELLFLHELDDIMLKGAQLSEIFKAITDGLMRYLGYDAADIFTLNEDGESLTWHTLSIDKRLWEVGEKLSGIKISGFQIPLRPGTNFYEVITKKKPVVLNNMVKVFEDLTDKTHLQKAAPAVAKMSGFKTVIRAPLIFEEKVTGVIGVASRGDLTGDDVETVERLSWHLAVLVSKVKTEGALKESEEKLSSFMDSATDVFALFDSELNLIDVNRAGLEWFGVRKEDVLGRNMVDLVPYTKGTVRREKYKEVIKTGRPLSIEGLIPHPRFGEAYVALKVFKVGGGLGMIVSDVTEQKKADNALRESEERLRKVLSSCPDAITVTDLKGNIIKCNQAALDLHGFSSKEEFIGKSALDLCAPKDRQRAMENLEKTLAQGSVRGVEYTLLTRNGRKFQGELSASVVLDPDGRPMSFVGVTKDITERKKVERELEKHRRHLEELVGQRTSELQKEITERKRGEEELRESEAKYQNLVESARDGIVIIQKGRHAFVNSAAAQMLGYTVEELIGKDFTIVIPPEERDAMRRRYSDRVKGKDVPTVYELNIVKKDGTRLPAEVNTVVIDYGGAPADMVLVRDLTERKRIEKRLRESEELLRMFMDSATDGFTLFDSKLNVLDVNEAALKIFGFKRGEVVGKNIEEIVPDIKETGRYDEYLKVMKTGGPSFVEDLVPHPKFGNVHISVKIFKVGDGVGLITTDVTERKKAEDELNKKLEELERMNRLMVGREVRMKELKEQIKKLEAEAAKLRSSGKE